MAPSRLQQAERSCLDSGSLAVRSEATKTLTMWIRGEARPGDTVLLMGARDPELPALARAVFAALVSEADRRS